MAVQAQQYSENMSGGGFGFWNSQEGFDQSLYLHLQQQQQQQPMMINMNQQKIQNNHNLDFDYDVNQVVSTDSSNHISPSMAFSDGLLAQLEKKQRRDTDQIIDIQYARLRLALHEQRKQQLGVLLNSFESKALSLLNQKEEQLTEMTRKKLQLEECLRRSEMENQAWQRVAKENESMILSLNNTLEQVRENAVCLSSSIVEDAGSCCDFSDQPESNKEEDEKFSCKLCKSRESCLLFLPCRHLCSCKLCEAFLDSCPICKSVKKATIEVYFS